MSRRSGIQIAWKTVTYRSVMLMVGAVLTAAALGANMAFPEFTQSTMKSASNTFTNLMERLAGSGDAGKPGGEFATGTHHRFRRKRSSEKGQQRYLGARRLQRSVRKRRRNTDWFGGHGENRLQ